MAFSLDAFKNTLDSLEKYYTTLAITPSTSMDRTLPYPTSYQDETGQQIGFTYRSRIREMFVFRASVDGSDEATLCVKFTRKYSEEAHRFLADLGHAPPLRAVTPLSGGWIMVVMDSSNYVSLHSMRWPENQSYEQRCALKEGIESRIKDVLQKLHDASLVHGDVRDINILIDEESLIGDEKEYGVHLIDFDWAGREEVVRYPGRVNTVTVRRPRGVSDWELITREYDMGMVDFLWF